MYTITLTDGTKLENLKLNGNNYISEEIIDDTVFEGNLDNVTITDGEITETYEHMRLLCNRVDDGRSWFVLGEKTAQQIKEEAMAREIAELRKMIDELIATIKS